LDNIIDLNDKRNERKPKPTTFGEIVENAVRRLIETDSYLKQELGDHRIEVRIIKDIQIPNPNPKATKEYNLNIHMLEDEKFNTAKYVESLNNFVEKNDANL
jgi:hypothetical protein